MGTIGYLISRVGKFLTAQKIVRHRVRSPSSTDEAQQERANNPEPYTWKDKPDIINERFSRHTLDNSVSHATMHELIIV